MKTTEDYRAFIKAVRLLCESHHIGIVGTCYNESIYGEITLFDLDHPEDVEWIDIEKHAFNFKEPTQ